MREDPRPCDPEEAEKDARQGRSLLIDLMSQSVPVLVCNDMEVKHEHRGGNREDRVGEDRKPCCRVHGLVTRAEGVDTSEEQASIVATHRCLPSTRHTE